MLSPTRSQRVLLCQNCGADSAGPAREPHPTSRLSPPRDCSTSADGFMTTAVAHRLLSTCFTQSTGPDEYGGRARVLNTAAAAMNILPEGTAMESESHRREVRARQYPPNPREVHDLLARIISEGLDAWRGATPDLKGHITYLALFQFAEAA